MRLADYTTVRLGGPARGFVRAGTEEELIEAVRAADAAGEPVLILGGGSNLVVSPNAAAVPVRLVKGAYREPPSVAFPRKQDVDENYVALMKTLLDHGVYPAIATHDERIIQEAMEYVEGRSIRQDSFEFQMLYGIRRDLQRKLIDARLPAAAVRSLRDGVVSVLHAAAGGASGESVVRGAEFVEVNVRRPVRGSLREDE